jgi:hypothetical protein
VSIVFVWTITNVFKILEEKHMWCKDNTYWLHPNIRNLEREKQSDVISSFNLG